MQLRVIKIVVLLVLMLLSLSRTYSQCVGPTTNATSNAFSVSLQGSATGYPLQATVTTITNVSCPGYSDGAIDISVTGGSPPYTFAWSDSSFDEDADNLVAGTYSVVIGDANNCSFSITDILVIEDDHILPIITCPADITQTADPSVCQAAISVPLAVASDNCIIVTIVNDYTHTADASAIYPVGTTVVTWTVTDGSNNTATCAQTITVTDDEMPAFVDCPFINTTATATAGTCDVSLSVVPPATTDNCSVSGVVGERSDGLALNSPYPVGVTLLSWVLSDIHGNTSSCKQRVEVYETEPPVFAACPLADITADADPNLCEKIGLIFSQPIATDNCSGVTITGVRSDALDLGDPYPLGTTVIVWTAADIVGNTSSCQQNVLISDIEPPVFVCPTVSITEYTDDGQCQATNVMIQQPIGMDNCGTFTIISSVRSDAQVMAAPFNLGTTTITWTATDAAGNTNTCSQDVIVIDVDAPVFSNCPITPITESLDIGACTKNIAVAQPAGYDNCSTFNPIGTRSDGQALNDPYSAGITTIVWTATDASGNSSTCMQQITLNDTQAPQFAQCPLPDLSSSGTCAGATLTINTPSVSDNCSVVSIVGVRSDLAPLTAAYPGGTTVITWTATDTNGNLSTCTQNVVVSGTAASLAFATCPLPDLTATTVANVCNAPVTILTPQATNSCSGDIATVNGTRSDNLTINDPYPVGTTVITWTASNAMGQTAVCTQNVIVSDGATPVFALCPLPNLSGTTNGSCTATVSVTPPSGSDACGIFNVVGTRSDGQSLSADYPIGNTIITWTADDGNGNVAICTQNVLISDNTIPTFADCPLSPITATLTSGCSAIVTIPVPTVNDNCGGTVQVAGTRSDNQALNVPYPKGTTTITWTAFDAVGNQTTCTQTVVINDLTAPVFATCPMANVTATAATNTCSQIITLTTPTAGDNCSGSIGVSGTRSDGQLLSAAFSVGTTIVTWTATDVSGNTAICTQNVIVTDVTAPVLSGVPTNTTVSCPIPAPPTVTATDNCSGSVTVNYSQSPATVDCTTGGTITRTWTATDAAGNTVTQTQTITVTGSSPPLTIASYTIINAQTGVNNGSISIVPSGGNCGGAYTYQWSGPSVWTGASTATGPTISGLPGGYWYFVTVTCGTQTVVGSYWVKNGRTRTKAEDNTGTIEAMQVFPNPFQAVTSILFELNEQQSVQLIVYDMAGREVSLLFKGTVEADKLQEISFEANDLPAGTYICRLITEKGETVEEKLVLLK